MTGSSGATSVEDHPTGSAPRAPMHARAHAGASGTSTQVRCPARPKSMRAAFRKNTARERFHGEQEGLAHYRRGPWHGQ